MDPVFPQGAHTTTQATTCNSSDSTLGTGERPWQDDGPESSGATSPSVISGVSSVSTEEDEKGEKESKDEKDLTLWQSNDTTQQNSDVEAAHTETLQVTEDDDDFPEGGLRAWLVVLSAFLLLLPSFGFMVSIGTLQAHWSTHQLSSHSSAAVGWIPSVFVWAALALGAWTGPLFDAYGPRWPALVGSVGYVAAVFLLAECTQYWHFLLCCGVLGGAAGSLLCVTAMAVVAHWFRARRGLAQGVAMVGSSLGGLAIPLFLRYAFPALGYAWSLRILGSVFLFCFILGNLLIKGRIPPTRTTTTTATSTTHALADALPPTPLEKPNPLEDTPAACSSRTARAATCIRKTRNALAGVLSLHIFRDPSVCLLTAGVLGFELILFGALGILPTYVERATPFAADAGFDLVAVLNGASCLGRMLPGWAADRLFVHLHVHHHHTTTQDLSRCRYVATLLAMMAFVLASMAGVWWLPLALGRSSLPALYAFVALFGFGTGSWMALTPACIGQLCRAAEFGRYYGTVYFFASIATLVAVPLSAHVLERAGAGALIWMYCGILAASMVSVGALAWRMGRTGDGDGLT